MQKAPTDTLTMIIGKSLVGIGSLVTEFIDRLRAIVVRARKRFATPAEILELARAKLTEFEPLLAEHLSDTTLASWIAGFDSVAKIFPPWLQREFSSGIRFNEPPSKPPRSLFQMFEGEPRLRLPIIENAAQRLLERNILTREQFDTADELTQQQAFTIAGDLNTETIDRLRGFLVEDLYQGTSLDGFSKRVEDHLGTSPIAPGHLENVYRTNIQSSLRDGRETLRTNPIVAATFPYQEYIPIHDGRTRHNHELLGQLGLNGTGIYNASDPFWDHFTPPWDFNCLLPDTVVQGRFEYALKSWYAGEAVEVVTRSGQRLRATVNHPVLTSNGFKAAGALEVGENCLRYDSNINSSSDTHDTVASSSIAHATFDPRRFSPDVHENYNPTHAAEVFASLALHRKLSRLPLAPNDLHGEAKCGDGYVDVVGADWQLRNDFESLSDDGRDLLFVVPDKFSASGLKTALSNGRTGLLSNCLARGYSPSSTALSLDSLPVVSHQIPLRQLCVGPAAYLNASRYELPLEGVSSASSLEGQLLQRCSRFVTLDEIVEVRRYNFSGHVYDFQSAGGWMVADGLIVSNCRCSVRLLTLEAAASAGVKEAQLWLKTGNAPRQPEYRLSHIPFEPKPGFGARGRVGVLV